SYRLQRVVPPGIVALGLKASAVAPGEPNIVTAYAIYNLVLLLGVLVLWNDIADRTGVGVPGRWLGFLLMFVSFGTARVPFYLPVTSDVSALFLGALLVALHLRNQGPGMLATFVVGSFTWPSFLAMGAPLYVLPPPTTSEPPESLPPRRAWAAGGAVALVALANVLTFLPRLELPPNLTP